MLRPTDDAGLSWSWRLDLAALDEAMTGRAFGHGGLTCLCNMGGQCRTRHQLKQHPGWTLTEPAPGIFRWTTPTGRSYIVRPDPLAA